jgi:hypothetical protein
VPAAKLDNFLSNKKAFTFYTKNGILTQEPGVGVTEDLLRAVGGYSALWRNSLEFCLWQNSTRSAEQGWSEGEQRNKWVLHKPVT